MSAEISDDSFRANIIAQIKEIQETLNELKTIKRKTVKRKPAKRRTKAKRKTVKRKPAKRRTKAKRKNSRRRQILGKPNY